MDLSVCVPVYKAHEPPNVASLAAALPAASGSLEGELVVALNGIDACAASVPSEVRSVALDTNRGVAPGWNAAAHMAAGDVLVFANTATITGVFVPTGTPAAIVDLLQKEIATVVKSPEIKGRLLEMGVVPEGDSPASFAAYVKADIAKWKRVIEQATVPKI